MCAANAAGGTLVILPAVPFRRCGCGGASGLEWCAGVVSVAVSFFSRIFHFAAGDVLAMLPVVPIRRCGGGVARRLEWCAEVVLYCIVLYCTIKTLSIKNGFSERRVKCEMVRHVKSTHHIHSIKSHINKTQKVKNIWA